MCHCCHPFQLYILHNHEAVFYYYFWMILFWVFLFWIKLLSAMFSAEPIKKNKSFYFTITYSFPIALLLFGWVSDLTHFPSQGMSSGNKFHQCLSKKVFISHSLLKDKVTEHRILDWKVFFSSTLMFHSTIFLLRWLLRGNWM